MWEIFLFANLFSISIVYIMPYYVKLIYAITLERNRISDWDGICFGGEYAKQIKFFDSWWGFSKIKNTYGSDSSTS